MTMAAFCMAHRVPYEWIMPDPAGGRQATYFRDVSLARRADLLLAFFAGETMAGGTGHLTEMGIAAGTPTYAWGYTGEHFMRIGEYDPDNTYGYLVPWV